MKYFQVIILFLILLFVFSCSSDGLQEQVVKTEFGTQIFYIDKDSLKQGLFVDLTATNDTFAVAHYQGDKLNGERKIYDPTGFVATKENYKNDQFHGPIETYYSNGQIETKGNFTNNVLDSDFYAYYESGELKEKVTIADNEENGPFEEYYKSGNVHWKGNFKNGPNEDGLLLEYDETGTIIKKMMCGEYKGEYICQTIWDQENGDQPLKLQYEN